MNRTFAAAIAAMRSRRYLSIAITLAWMVVLAFLAAAVLVPSGPAALASELGISAESSVDIAGIVRAGAEALFALVAAVLTVFISRHLKDSSAKTLAINTMAMLAGWGINKMDGAFKDRPMNVNVGSAAAASILRNTLALGQDVIGRTGWDERTLAKMAVAKLPGIDGGMDETTIDKIVAAAKAGPGASPAPTLGDLSSQAIPLAEMVASALLPHLEAMIAAKIAPAAPKPVV